METANIMGRQVVCVRRPHGLVTRLDAVCSPNALDAQAKCREVAARGMACEVVKMGRTYYVVVR
ncbi:hypothetical protein VT84_13860 [Gemmata sp. SH-PL17]|uniref:hypothetical protein n=1 Tax=Gemmata sp. SH-PL17 TaxID=1630693 RepID=UPI00078B91FA|nr:hypothetical protein [Gemmata sp. SH-PL17]AMV25479.1 hypothetical protein VT84_13860 [Gemmata sp. SH-PL17]